MTDLLRRIGEAACHVAPRWTAGREQLVLGRVEAARSSRRLTSWALALTAIAAVALVLVAPRLVAPGGAGELDDASPPAASVSSREQERPHPERAKGEVILAFGDGSRVEAMSSSARATLLRESPKEVVVALNEGHARFDITPGMGREFKVVSSPISVTVLGTIFDVTSSAQAVRVKVLRGLVRVDSPAGSWKLAAGESGTFGRSLEAGKHGDSADAVAPSDEMGHAALAGETAPITFALDDDSEELGDQTAEAAEASAASDEAVAGSSESPPAAEEGEAPLPDEQTEASIVVTAPARVSLDDTKVARAKAKRSTPRRAKSRAAVATPRWEALAEQGSQALAYEELVKTRAWNTLTDTSQLMLAADVARASGDFQRATAALQRVVALHPSDGRAPLAAFTAGKLLLERLGKPRLAARAFEQVRRLAPGGPLAEDALARKVEALARSGARSQAARLAEQYFREYPKGRRRPLVERYATGTAVE